MATLVSASAEVVQDLRQKLIAADTPLAAKYRALYSLRGVEGSEAHLGLVDGECLSCYHSSRHNFPGRGSQLDVIDWFKGYCARQYMIPVLVADYRCIVMPCLIYCCHCPA